MTSTIELPEKTLATLQAGAWVQGWSAEQGAADRPAALYAEQDDEEAALNEAIDEMEAGQGRPFEEFAQEFPSRFAARESSLCAL